MGSEESVLQEEHLLAPLKQKASHWRWEEPTLLAHPDSSPFFGNILLPPHHQPRVAGPGVKWDGTSHTVLKPEKGWKETAEVGGVLNLAFTQTTHTW